ncbi:uncharacterized protein MYCFIDRAFT_79248 [Pseudocercospora fijiensis CIRAD86]|uniref:RRM domain-containing protein n=1 Tax=Pseudocercospora fijiensis (strain CIRAD86) TaxID=383855 RepID=M2YJS6_PSEFD|nr:uncharacterized protein MYCFIDRAFT_79248 [Pseudocercospora fijiensis CIRAD86]EME78010.1 hypothetical protein MYCFIDRAFT_79248 [Pseudocercospora fijiensis CIRAD86]
MSKSSYGAQRGSGPYFIHIENLPKRYTWQDLKDLIRRHAAHGIWTEMAVYPNGQTGGKGYARVQRQDEAIRLYIHLWDISDDPAQFVRCNCASNSQSHPSGARIFQMAAQPGWQRFTPTSPLGAPNPSYPVSPGPGYFSPTMAPPVSAPVPPPAMPQPTFEQLAAWMATMSLDYRNQAHVAQARQVYQTRQAQIQASQYPTYTTGTTGLPTNTTRGLVRTQARGIFVSGIDFKARQKDIERHFRQAGEIVKLELQKDASTGKSKGNATILYTNAEAAQEAIEIFDRQKFMSMQLRVRPDKETTVVAPPPQASAGAQRRTNMEPTIVNGSQKPDLKARRACRVTCGRRVRTQAIA